MGKYLSHAFRIQNGLKQGDAFITIAFQLWFRIRYQEDSIKERETGIE
jgi:hypothetical protein